MRDAMARKTQKTSTLNPLQRHLPKASTVMKSSRLKKYSHFYTSRRLGRFDRHSVAAGVAVGLFVNFIPLPVQILWAFMLAVYFRANLPIAVALTWINNPITFIPINYFIYKVGATLLNQPPDAFSLPAFMVERHHFMFFMDECLKWLGAVGKPYVVGIVIVSTSSALIGYCFTHILWRAVILTRRWLNNNLF